jgi:hypothetical protein
MSANQNSSNNLHQNLSPYPQNSQTMSNINKNKQATNDYSVKMDFLDYSNSSKSQREEVKLNKSSHKFESNKPEELSKRSSNSKKNKSEGKFNMMLLSQTEQMGKPFL